MSLVRRFKVEAARTMVALQNRLAYSPGTTAELVERFHALYYDAAQVDRGWAVTHFLGVPILKNPLDLWLFQELIYRLKPDLLVETGTFLGGSAFYYASLFDLIGRGQVLTIDVWSGERCARERKQQPERVRPIHPRITYLEGSSVAEPIAAEARRRAAQAGTVLVVLDSDHSRDHVLKELELYAPLVTPGSYLVVEDGNINGHPVLRDFGPGPFEAVEEWLPARKDFQVDRELEETHLFSFNRNGYLRRVAAP
jgi:cephalosporin hydroxylase